jgi:flagellar biosynthesis protein
MKERTVSMSAHERGRGAGRAVALSYDGGSGAPVVVASGMGYVAEKIVEVAAESGVPVYEDNSLATMLSQLSLGQEIPDSLYRAIVEIYVYFLNFDPADPDKAKRQRQERQAAPAEGSGHVEEGGAR